MTDAESDGTVEYYVEDATAISVLFTRSLSGSSSRSSTGGESPVPAAKTKPFGEIAALARYPLGSWERHVVEERLRAIKRHERERILRAEIEKECTFKPRVISSDGHTRSASTGAPQPESDRRTQVFMRLTERAKKRDARIAQLKAEKELKEEEALRDAFKPRVNAAGEPKSALNVRSLNVPVEERLLHYGKTIEESRRLLQEERRREELKEMRNGLLPRRERNNAPKKEERDIAYRSQHLIIEREKERALAQKALLEQHPFRPKVCSTSDAIDRERRAQYNAKDRGALLYAEGLHRQRRRQEEVVRQQKREFSGSGKPTTSPLTNDWIYHGQHRALFEQNFVRRQELYQQVREEHQRRLALALEENDRKAAEIPRIDPAMIEEQVERLYLGGYGVGKESKKCKDRLDKDDGCSFRPQLAPGTAYVIAHSRREPDVVKRLAASTQRRRCASDVNLFGSYDEGNEEREEKAKNKNSNARTVGPEEAEEFYQRQKRAVEERQAQLRERKQRLAMEELFACTFRPKTCTDGYQQRRQREVSPERQKEYRVEARVSGVTAYLQRQAEAKRQRDDLRARYENLGRLSSSSARGPTVIKPFNLSSGRASRTRCLSSATASQGCNSEVEEREGNRHTDLFTQQEVIEALDGKREPASARCHHQRTRGPW